MGCATVEPLAVPPAQDPPFVALSHGEIDGAGCPRHERDHRGLFAPSDDREGPVSALDGEVLDVRAARSDTRRPLRPSRTASAACIVSYRSAVNRKVPTLRCGPSRAPGLGDLGAANVLGGVGGDATVDVGEPV